MNKATTLAITIPLLTAAFSVSSFTNQSLSGSKILSQQSTSQSAVTHNNPMVSPFLPDNGDYRVAVDFQNTANREAYIETAKTDKSITIHSDGSFSYQGSGSCKAMGNFETDASEYNRLGVNIIFEQSCYPMVGTHKGHVWKTHHPDQQEYKLVIYNDLDQSTKAVGWRLNKTQVF